jgi:hypothetical protein
MRRPETDEPKGKEEMKGKCFSAVNRGQRKKSDFYETPYSMTRQLLEVENFNGTILEPACGNGAIVNVLFNGNIKHVFAYDLVNQNNIEADFLKETKLFNCIER